MAISSSLLVVLPLKKREDELQLSVNNLEIKESELQKTTTDSNQHVAEFQKTNADLETEQVAD